MSKEGTVDLNLLEKFHCPECGRSSYVRCMFTWEENIIWRSDFKCPSCFHIYVAGSTKIDPELHYSFCCEKCGQNTCETKQEVPKTVTCAYCLSEPQEYDVVLSDGLKGYWSAVKTHYGC